MVATQSSSQAPATQQASSSSNLDWYPDSGATNQLTADLGHLSLQSDYTGPDTLKIGNGVGLPITHVGSSTLHTSIHYFLLNKILRVPAITLNLLSVSQF